MSNIVLLDFDVKPQGETMPNNFIHAQHAGGPRHNTRSQIVWPDGSPIPRLYSAGELGSIYSYMYQGTGNIGECLAFGRIAGRNAATEHPWC
jgi:predicted oxidoreductase